MDAHDLTTLSPETIARFWSRVDTSAGPDACWPWMAATTRGGYGHMAVNGRHLRANRLSLAISGAPPPCDAFVCHSCDNPACVNPSHLWIGSPKDNVDDMLAKGRGSRGDMHGEAVRRRVPRGEDHYLRRDPGMVRRGADHPNAKLIDSEMVLRMLAGGVPRRAIADAVGVGRTVIDAVANGTHWTVRDTPASPAPLDGTLGVAHRPRP